MLTISTMYDLFINLHAHQGSTWEEKTMGYLTPSTKSGLDSIPKDAPSNG